MNFSLEQLDPKDVKRAEIRKTLGDEECTDELCDNLAELDIIDDCPNLREAVEGLENTKFVFTELGDAEVTIVVEPRPKNSWCERDGFYSISVQVMFNERETNYHRFILITPIGVHFSDYDASVAPEHAAVIDALDTDKLATMIMEDI